MRGNDDKPVNNSGCKRKHNESNDVSDIESITFPLSIDAKDEQPRASLSREEECMFRRNFSRDRESESEPESEAENSAVVDDVWWLPITDPLYTAITMLPIEVINDFQS